MKVSRLIAIFAGTFAIALLSGSGQPGWSQSSGNRPDPHDATFARLRETQKKIGRRAVLSGGARSLFRLANHWDRIKGAETEGSPAAAQPSMPPALEPGLISAPPDLNLLALGVGSRLRGFIANESSTAWCGNNVVVGFNSTTNAVPSAVSNSQGSFDFIGYSVSTDGGSTFTDEGFPTVPSDSNSTLGFDQVMTCTSAENFYFSALYNTPSETAVSVSASTNGGRTFGAPIAAASDSNPGQFFDGDWMATNPGNPRQLFVSYTHDDFAGARCGNDSNGNPILGTAIELVSSNDGGGSWTSPVVVAQTCVDPAGFGSPVLEFSQVAVDPSGGTVYVAWENFHDLQVSDFPNLPREIDIAKSSTATIAFSNPVKVSDVKYIGTIDNAQFGGFQGSPIDQILQGRIVTGEHPSLAIGKGPKNTGTLYVAWNDGTDRISDTHSNLGVYNFSDILLASSTDGGNNWSAPVRVNDNAEDVTTRHLSDQFHPAVATDKNGKIGVCFYDRRNDPLNFLIGRTCAMSMDGNTWRNIAIDSTGGPSVVNQDDFTINDWLGDYETLAGDSLNQNAGFVGGYTNTSTGYQNIRENRFPGSDRDRL